MTDKPEFGFGAMGRRQVEAAERIAQEMKARSQFPVGDVEAALRVTAVRVSALTNNKEHVQPEQQWQNAVTHELTVLTCLLNELPRDHQVFQNIAEFVKEHGHPS